HQARRADGAAEHRVDALPVPAAVVGSEHEAEAERGGHEAEAEGAEVDEAAPDQHQPAHAHERNRHDVGGGAEEVVRVAREPRPDAAAVPAPPQTGAEEDAERDERETGEFRPMVAGETALARGGALLLADARRLPRAQLPRPLLASHAADF